METKTTPTQSIKAKLLSFNLQWTARGTWVANFEVQNPDFLTPNMFTDGSEHPTINLRFKTHYEDYIDVYSLKGESADEYYWREQIIHEIVTSTIEQNCCLDIEDFDINTKGF